MNGGLAGVSPPLLVKIAPDLDDGPLADVVGVSLEAGVDGLIVSNTTLARPAGLRARHAGEAGGLSGRPLFELSTRVTAKTFRLVAGRVPVIGAGGIEGGATAYAKIRAGASLVQLYTALVYRGPGLFRSIAGDIAARLAADGHARVADAVGLDAARWAG